MDIWWVYQVNLQRCLTAPQRNKAKMPLMSSIIFSASCLSLLSSLWNVLDLVWVSTDAYSHKNKHRHTVCAYTDALDICAVDIHGVRVLRSITSLRLTRIWLISWTNTGLTNDLLAAASGEQITTGPGLVSVICQRNLCHIIIHFLTDVTLLKWG